MTAATHVRVLCMRYCKGLIAYILLHYLMKFHLVIAKDKEMTIFLYVLSDHPKYNFFSSYICNFKPLAFFCDFTEQLRPNLVENPED